MERSDQAGLGEGARELGLDTTGGVEVQPGTRVNCCFLSFGYIVNVLICNALVMIVMQ